jgi:hypothetical protein
MQWDDGAFGDETPKKNARLFERGEGRSGGRSTEDRLDEAGRGRWKLLSARRVEDEAGGVDPVTEGLGREERLAIVVPMGEARGGQMAGGRGYRGTQSNAFLPGLRNTRRNGKSTRAWAGGTTGVRNANGSGVRPLRSKSPAARQVLGYRMMKGGGLIADMMSATAGERRRWPRESG